MTASRRRILAVGLAALLLAAAAVGIALWARGVLSDATAGKAAAQAGAKHLAAMDTTAAVTDFRTAGASFAAMSSALGPDWVARAVGPVPWAGRQYAAARSLARIGHDGSRAGLELAEAVRATPEQTATAGSPEALSSRLAHVDAGLGALASVLNEAETLKADGLVPPLAKAVRSVRSAVDTVGPFADRLPALARLWSYLLSGNHRIIVVSQDGAELRPTGGWSGSFGVVDVGASGAKLESYQDVFVIPNPVPPVERPFGAYQTPVLNFRNANWWLDFPTSAQRMLEFWGRAGQQPVDGIVVIDTRVMADLLGVVGPIAVPEFRETFTSENLLDRLLYLTQVQRAGQPDRKDVLVSLAGQLEKRVFSASAAELLKIALVVGKAADEKHVQMYFTDPAAQAAAVELGWSGSVAPPKGATDMVAISNAMNKPGKVNIAMSKTIRYDVALAPDHSAQTTLSLGYANTGPYDYPYLPPDFRDWLRVYRLPGTIFPPRRPDGSKTVTTTEFGFPADVRTFTVPRGARHTEVLAAAVPQALQPVSAQQPASGKQESALRYRLYLVRQADLQDIPTTVAVFAPSGWKVTGAAARLVASGASVPVTAEKDRAVFAAPLTGDLVLDVAVASP